MAKEDGSILSDIISPSIVIRQKNSAFREPGFPAPENKSFPGAMSFMPRGRFEGTGRAPETRTKRPPNHLLFLTLVAFYTIFKI
jgi:hypothetical protein